MAFTHSGFYLTLCSNNPAPCSNNAGTFSFRSLMS